MQLLRSQHRQAEASGAGGPGVGVPPRPPVVLPFLLGGQLSRAPREWMAATRSLESVHAYFREPRPHRVLAPGLFLPLGCVWMMGI